MTAILTGQWMVHAGGYPGLWSFGRIGSTTTYFPERRSALRLECSKHSQSWGICHRDQFSDLPASTVRFASANTIFLARTTRRHGPTFAVPWDGTRTIAGSP